MRALNRERRFTWHRAVADVSDSILSSTGHKMNRLVINGSLLATWKYTMVSVFFGVFTTPASKRCREMIVSFTNCPSFSQLTSVLVLPLHRAGSGTPYARLLV